MTTPAAFGATRGPGAEICRRALCHSWALAILLSGCASSWNRATTPGPLVSGGCSESGHGAWPAFDAKRFMQEHPERIVPPKYSQLEKDRGVEGVVKVAALICEHGKVVDVRVLESNPTLDEAATAAVRVWRYKPAHDEGKPAARWIQFPVRFAMN